MHKIPYRLLFALVLRGLDLRYVSTEMLEMTSERPTSKGAEDSNKRWNKVAKSIVSKLRAIRRRQPSVDRATQENAISFEYAKVCSDSGYFRA